MAASAEKVRLPLDTASVLRWLSAHGHDVASLDVLGQFGAGQSNPTYLLLSQSAAGAPPRDATHWVG